MLCPVLRIQHCCSYTCPAFHLTMAFVICNAGEAPQIQLSTVCCSGGCSLSACTCLQTGAEETCRQRTAQKHRVGGPVCWEASAASRDCPSKSSVLPSPGCFCDSGSSLLGSSTYVFLRYEQETSSSGQHRRAEGVLCPSSRTLCHPLFLP